MIKRASLKDLGAIAKKIVKKGTIKKIKSVKDKKEQEILYEYTIKAALEFKFAELKKKIEELEKTRRDLFVARTKMHLLGTKVHFFNATLYKKDFIKIMSLFKEIEKEIKKDGII